MTGANQPEPPRGRHDTRPFTRAVPGFTCSYAELNRSRRRREFGFGRARSTRLDVRKSHISVDAGSGTRAANGLNCSHDRHRGLGRRGVSEDLRRIKDMALLLLSLGVGAVPDFITAHVNRPANEIRVGYLNDAASPHTGEEFVAAERQQLAELGYPLIDITADHFDDADAFAAALDDVDVLYVAGGNTFALLAALRRRCGDSVLIDRVRGGLPYIGSSAGSIITGLSIEPVSLMDDPADAPDLLSRDGLGLIDAVVIPHADGQLPPYPPALIARIKQTYEADYPLTFINDDQALLVENAHPSLIASP